MLMLILIDVDVDTDVVGVDNDTDVVILFSFVSFFRATILQGSCLLGLIECLVVYVDWL